MSSRVRRALAAMWFVIAAAVVVRTITGSEWWATGVLVAAVVAAYDGNVARPRRPALEGDHAGTHRRVGVVAFGHPRER